MILYTVVSAVPARLTILDPPSQHTNTRMTTKRGRRKDEDTKHIDNPRATLFLDNTKNKSKTRRKLRQTQDREISPKKHTKHDTNEKVLFRQLEKMVQDHIENQLKLRHNGQLPYKRFS
jgi:hypothetical protein